jgi:hypothetical protein
MHNLAEQPYRAYRNPVNIREAKPRCDCSAARPGLGSRMAEKVLGALISAVFAGFAGLAGFFGVIGPTLAAALSLIGAICGPTAFLIYRRYLGVLGAGARPKGSPARQAYDALRESLSEGNMAARLYAIRLTAFLDWIDRFFGDAGMADRTLFPRAFGLKTPAPLWTAPAFDRCLLLALIYPIATIFLIWAVSGHVGPAEAALYLRSNLSAWRRALAAATVAFPVFAFWRAMRTRGQESFTWGAVAVAVAVFGVGADGGAVAFAAIVAGVLAGASAGTVAGVVAGAGAFSGALAVAVAGNIIIAVFGPQFSTDIVTGVWVLAIVVVGIGVVAVAGAFGVAWLNDRSTEHQWRGVFLSLFSVSMVLACLGAANVLSPLGAWKVTGALLLFLGLLTLLNAPFDWASLGLTRALLRRGIELGGWWPYFLALVDAVLAAVIVAALALTMVIGVQAFDGLAEHGGGIPVLPLDPLFDGIAASAADPEYWWLYALLLSTVIPSLINLMIGGASLLRGLPGLPSLILRFMPVGKAVPTFDRNWIALVLTLQIVVGALFGIVAQAILVVVVIGYVMPWLGLGLLDLAHDVAAFNLPLRIGQLFAGIFQ